MSKEKAIEKIHKSIDILKWYRVSKNEKNKAVCFLSEALKELEDLYDDSEILKKLAHSILKDTTSLDSNTSQLVGKNFWDLC